MNRLTAMLPLLALSACGAPASPPPDESASASVSVMTFNVENLFDNVDDPGKDDKAYLAIEAKQNDAHIAECNEIEVDRWRDECLNLDWSDEAIDFKLGVLAEAIRQIDGGPDVIAFQEIENLGMLERLNDEYLADLGYGEAVLIEGEDNRGIDVAFLSRLTIIGEPVLHAASFPDFPEREGDTRGILEATFELSNGDLLTGYSVHFPAPFHPTAMRETAYEQLNALLATLPEDRPVFAAGDFNTTSAEMAGTDILDQLVRPDWIIAHETGCDGCRGTAYYARDDSWSFLDMILFSASRSENTTLQIRAGSVQIANQTDAQVTVEGTPARFRSAERSGVSDHWPLIVTLETTRKQ